MHTLAVLNQLERMEIAMAKLYRYYADCFKDDPEASTAFFYLYLEERSHASIVRYQRNMAWRNPKLFMTQILEGREILAVIKKAEALAVPGRKPTLAQALRAAAEFESGAAAVHFRLALHHAEPTFSELVYKLGGDDRDHFRRITFLAGQRGIVLEQLAPHHTDEAVASSA